jgi:H+/gluconate symporter-like permease
MGLTDNPVIGLAIVVNVLAGITGSASGGMSIALQAVGQHLPRAGAGGRHQPADPAPRRDARFGRARRAAAQRRGDHPAGHLRMNHKQSYFDIFMVAVAFPLLAMVVVIVLNGMFGTF